MILAATCKAPPLPLGGFQGREKVTKTITFNLIEKLVKMIAQHICLWMIKEVMIKGKRVWNTYQYRIIKNPTLADL